MKHGKEYSLLSYLNANENSSKAKDFGATAEYFELSYGEAVGVSTFYSAINGLPSEERLEPTLKAAGPIIDYSRHRVWSSLGRVRTDPEFVIKELELSGLCGRGGAAFSTAKKWRSVKDSDSETKYIICNVSEGECGTAKDLYLLKNCPEVVIEGIAICAETVGAKKAFVYVRAGYEDAVQTIRNAVGASSAQLKELEVEVIENLGAYICGEETALVASLEGKRGEPCKKPPFPTEAGLLGMPTVINNAETFATIPLVVDIGGNAYKENETRLFTVTGCGAGTAICEMPVDSRPQDLYNVASCSKSAKGFMLGGGISGQFFPHSAMSIPLTGEAGDPPMNIGTASIRFISADESTKEICTEILQFYCNESCGKCVPCRWGTKKLVKMLTEGAEAKKIIEFSDYISASAFCGFGKSVSNALCSALNYFPEDFAGGKENII